MSAQQETKQVEGMAARMSVFPSFEAFQEEHGNKSMAARIRLLRSMQEKEDRGAIAKYLGIKYQWVRNVLIQPIKEA